jgi:hypothetical protein
MDTVGVDVDAPAQRDKSVAAIDDEKLLVVAAGRDQPAAGVLLGVAGGNAVQRSLGGVVQPRVVGEGGYEGRAVPHEHADLYAPLAGPREQVEERRPGPGEVDPWVDPPAEQVDVVRLVDRGLDRASDSGECVGPVDERPHPVAGEPEPQLRLPVGRT